VGQTIQIYLPEDEPRGLRIAQITTRLLLAVVIPRKKRAEATQRHELHNVGLYCLFTDSDEHARAQVYIGETENLAERFRDHDGTREDWSVAVALTTESRLTKAHVKWLEWYAICRCAEIGRYGLQNPTRPREPFLPEPLKADCRDLFETAEVLLAALGYPVFEPLRQAPEREIVFQCQRSGADARGVLNDDGFVVLAGSKALAQEQQSVSRGTRELRAKLLEDGTVVEEGGRLVFQQDYPFSSPSSAAAFVVGANANGWVEWRDTARRTLDEVYRQPAED
jgi:hypothetical protein